MKTFIRTIKCGAVMTSVVFWSLEADAAGAIENASKNISGSFRDRAWKASEKVAKIVVDDLNEVTEAYCAYTDA